MNILTPAKEESGVTLVELLIIVSIIGILSVALGFSFQGWMGNYKIESELKQIYADIMDARTRAMTQNRMHFIVINTDNYAVYEDTNDNNCFNLGSGDTLLKSNPLQYTIDPAVWTGTIGFDTRGLAWQYTVPPCTRVTPTPPTPTAPSAIPISITLPSGFNPDFNCIAVYQSRVAMGKMSGGVCVYK